MEWIYLISAIASSIAAALAWAAKLWWGKEFAAAKDEIIRAKEAQIEILAREIESLNQLTPMKIREYFVSVKEQLEEYNDRLRGQLVEAHQEIERKSLEITSFQTQGAAAAGKIRSLEEERAKISQAATQLEGQVAELRGKYEGKDVFVIHVPTIDPSVIERVTSSSAALAQALSRTQSVQFTKLSETLRDSVFSHSLPVRVTLPPSSIFPPPTQARFPDPKPKPAPPSRDEGH